jgi:hypothetical protein
LAGQSPEGKPGATFSALERLQTTEAFLRDFMAAFEVFIIRVPTVLPRKG